MQKKFGDFHVGESLEYALDIERGLFAPARVLRVTEHILNLEVETEEGTRHILGTVPVLKKYSLLVRIELVSFFLVAPSGMYMAQLLFWSL